MNPLNLLCHRKPERTFQIKGHYFPVCARCTGFYISMAVYLIYAFFFYVNYNITLLIIAVLLLLPAFIDGTTQFFHLRESNNPLRLITGLMGGLGLMIIFKAIKWYLLVVI
jgi:uncharacterized membrane protein